MRRGLRKTKQVIAGIMSAALLMTFLPQNSTYVYATEEYATDESTQTQTEAGKITDKQTDSTANEETQLQTEAETSKTEYSEKVKTETEIETETETETEIETETETILEADIAIETNLSETVVFNFSCPQLYTNTNIPNIRTKTIVERTALLNLNLQSEEITTSNKNILLARAFTKALELLREKTSLTTTYDNISLPDPRDPKSIPTCSTLNIVFRFPHNGKNKKQWPHQPCVQV